MPYYIYLHPSIDKDLQKFWEILKEGVSMRIIPDLNSLTYPPHITLTGHFDERKLSTDTSFGTEWISSVEKTFSIPFKTKPEDVKLIISKQILCVNIKWKELSERVTLLSKQYPVIPWQLDGYHLTLAHGPVNGKDSVLKECLKMLPHFNKAVWENFNVTIWSFVEKKQFNYSWESRKWTAEIEIPVKYIHGE